MQINLDLLKEVYDTLVENEDIYKINEYVGLDDEDTPTFEDFKDYFKSNIIATLQYDFNVRYSLDKLIF